MSHFRPGPKPQAEDVVDLGVIEAAGTEPLFVEEITGVYGGSESYSGDLLGRSRRDPRLASDGGRPSVPERHRLRRLDCTRGANPRAATLAADWGRLSGDYLAFDPDRAAALVGLLPADEGADSHRVGALGLVPLDGSPGRRIPLPKGFHGGQLIRRDGVSLWQPAADTATFLAGEQAGMGTSALRRLGRTAQLVVYEDQGHAIWEWEPKQAVDATGRMLDFLRRHLGMGRDPSNGR